MTEAADPVELCAMAAGLGMEISAETAGPLAAYATALWDWNTKINLTRHDDLHKFVSRDVWDSWHLAECLNEGEEILDVGSGGGVPGLCLAILRPDLQVAVCDGVAKKAKVLDDLVSGLDLPVPVYACRAEELLDDFRFDTLVARAVGPLWKLGRWFEDHWISIGRLLAIKGPNWPQERGEARHRGVLNGIELRKLKSYPMQDTESESVILQLRRPPAS